MPPLLRLAGAIGLGIMALGVMLPTKVENVSGTSTKPSTTAHGDMPGEMTRRDALHHPPLIALVINGDIYTIHTDGSDLRRLTDYGHNSNPRLSPHSALVAYLSIPRGLPSQGATASRHNVWIVPVNGQPDGSSAYRLTPTDTHEDRGSLAWSPNGQYLAYVKGTSVVVCDVPQRRCAPVYQLGGSTTAGNAIAWSPDSRRLAVALSNMGLVPASPRPAVLRIAIVRLGARGTTITVRFPFNDVEDAAHAAPDGTALAWAPGGRDLLVQTRYQGTHPTMSGIWQVDARGGRPHLLLGTTSNVMSPDLSTPQIFAATHFLLSPDGRSLATDPGGAFWVARADGTGGRFLPAINEKRGSQETYPTQFIWLPDSSGLAYVVVGPNGRSNEARLRLYSISLHSGARHLVLSIIGRDEFALQIAPAYRCVDCAG